MLPRADARVVVMIDIHHHCLPGVDDGPRDLEEAADLCHMAAEEGVDTIVATPHVLRGRWPRLSRTKIEALVAELRMRLGGKPRILPGSEYFFAHDMSELLRTGQHIVPLNDTRYVLVEFASHAVPPMIEQPFYHLQLDGWTPVIAHPERNVVFQKRPELLEALIRIGARTQITLGSLTGHFGEEARLCATSWLKRGLVHVAASDAHNTTKRPPRVRIGTEALHELVGEDVARALLVDNPRAIIEGRGLVYEPELPYPHQTRGFFAKLAKLLGRRE